MNSQFLKDHLLDFEVVTALGVGALLRYGFDTSWLFAILLGLSAFVLIPLLIRLAFHVRALYFMRLLRMGPDFLVSEQQALDVGFDEGRKKRIERGSEHEKHLEFDRDVYFESPWPLQRGKESLFNEIWRLGFDAGYLGQPKPPLPSQT
jgi:hypothetical protein